MVAEDICVPYGNNTGVNKCTGKDQILYDAKNNVGVCDCVEDERQLIYYKGECHIQNVQVRLDSSKQLNNFSSQLWNRDLALTGRG